MSIVIQGNPPDHNTIVFFDRLLPGIWQQWAGQAVAALTAVDENSGGETIMTSWFRRPNDNRRVGGHPDSQHLVGLAFDVVPGKGTSALALNEAAQIFTRFGFIAAVDPERSHVHIQTFPPGILRPSGVLDALNV